MVGLISKSVRTCAIATSLLLGAAVMGTTCDEAVDITLQRIMTHGGESLPKDLIGANGRLKAPSNATMRDQHRIWGFTTGELTSETPETFEKVIRLLRIEAGSLYDNGTSPLAVGSEIPMQVAYGKNPWFEITGVVEKIESTSAITTVTGSFKSYDDPKNNPARKFMIRIWHRPALGWDALSTVHFVMDDESRVVAGFNYKTHLKHLGRVRSLRNSRRGRGW